MSSEREKKKLERLERKKKRVERIIQANKFREHYYKSIGGRISKLPQEYREVCDVASNYFEKKLTYNDAQLPCNKDKNRFVNILPYDDTRVKLSVIENVEGSDYINASWISDLQKNNHAYICTQGPKKETIADFWRMIIESDVFTIVMLTRLMEKDEEKCYLYWPEELNTTVSFENGIEVLFLSEDVKPTIVIRKMKVTKASANYDREITQIQFTAWPDHGVPSPEEDYIELSDISDVANATNGPIVVHCSAGVGRSGTFCTIHSYLHLLRENVKNNNDLPELSISGTVLNLRKERAQMVQTEEQYEFIYRTIFKEFERLEEELKKKNPDYNNSNTKN